MTDHSVIVRGPVEIRLTVTPLPVDGETPSQDEAPVRGLVLSQGLGLGQPITEEPGVGAVVEAGGRRWHHMDCVSPPWMPSGRDGSGGWAHWSSVLAEGPVYLLLDAQR